MLKYFLIKALADLPSDFLDKPQDTLTTQKSETHSKKYHKVDLDRAETVNDDKVSKYKTTTLDSMTSTDSETTTMNPTELPDSEVTSTKAADSISTTEMTTNAETTTDASPTTGKIATSTEAAKTSTNSSTNVIPSSPGRHRLTWILGKFFQHLNSFFFYFVFPTKITKGNFLLSVS